MYWKKTLNSWKINGLLVLALISVSTPIAAQVVSDTEEGVDDGFKLPPAAVSVKPPIAIKGLTTEQIAKRYGAPDSKSGDAVRQSWKYGSSSIFFADDRVAGWSDAGELRERESLQSIKAEKRDPEEAPFTKDWVNPWTPRKDSPRGEVLRDIFD